MGAAPDQVVDQCPFEPVVDLVLGRWTSHMLWTLATEGRLRFSELHAQLPAVTPRVLTEAALGDGAVRAEADDDDLAEPARRLGTRARG